MLTPNGVFLRLTSDSYHYEEEAAAREGCSGVPLADEWMRVLSQSPRIRSFSSGPKAPCFGIDSVDCCHWLEQKTASSV